MTTSWPGWTLTPTRTTRRAYFSSRWSNGSLICPAKQSAPRSATAPSGCRRARASLQELREVLGEVELLGGLLVVDLVAVGVAERVARLLRRRCVQGGLLLRGLGGVAGDPLLALLALGLRLLAGTGALAAARPRHAGHPGHAATAGHLLHHLARLEEAVDELVDVGDLAAGALRDAGATRAVDDLRVVPLGGGHRLDDRLDAVDLALVEVLQLVTELTHAGEHPHDLGHRAELADLHHLLEEVLQGEPALGAELLGGLHGLLGVERLLGLLDEGEHVAHVEDAG